MAIARTAKGTVANKTSQATLTLSSVTLDAGSLLIVGLAYETDQGNPTSIKWGSRTLNIVSSTTFTRGDTRVRLYRARIKNTATRDIIVTWSGNVTAKAMFATQWSEVSVLDLSTGQDQALGTSLDTTSAGTSTVTNTASTAAFAIGGPGSELPGTAGSGHTLGQDVGTSGGAAGTNVAIQETYEILSATGTIQSTLTLGTARISASAVAAFKSQRTYTIKDAYRNTWVTDTNADDILINMEGNTGEIFQIHVNPDHFDDMSDTELNDHIKQACIWHLEHHVEGDNTEPEIPTAQQTRMDNLVDDTFEI